jgi:hypothetical protein
MFEFMMLQVVAIALVILFPPIATAFPDYLKELARRTPIELIHDQAPSLEEPYESSVAPPR